MDLSHFLADSPPTVVPLTIQPHFKALTEEQKLYAHHISRSAAQFYLVPRQEDVILRIRRFRALLPFATHTWKGMLNITS